MKHNISIHFCLAVILTLGICGGVNGQGKDAVQSINILMDNFFDAMRQQDTVFLADAFYPDAKLYTVIEDDENEISIAKNAVPEFIQRVGSSKQVLDERIANPSVNVDGPMATAWVPYQFFIDGKFHHCGVNAFQFVQTSSGWKISHIMDTRRTENCGR
jgi:hypothetical protein